MRQNVNQSRTDGKQVWDAINALYGYPVVLVAHELGLFPLLKQKSLTLQEIAERLHLAPRSARAVLSVCTSLDLLQVNQGKYSLTTVSEEYLLEESCTSLCGYLDRKIERAANFSYENIKKSILTNGATITSSSEQFESHQEDNEKARRFTKGMHSLSMASALAWPKTLNLTEYKHLLDVGGGSGAHCIGAILAWPNLKATVFDLASVCEVAQEFISQWGLQERIFTVAGNMWQDSFPSADLHFFSMIYHDWSPEKCRQLTQKSFTNLPSGGRLIVYEWLFNDDFSKPFSTACFDVVMLLWSKEGQQYSEAELSTMLTDVGFVDVEIKPNFGYYSIVTGRKP
ncbi:MAG: methyltransferase [Coleofasciculaceae cyanobacterium]